MPRCRLGAIAPQAVQVSQSEKGEISIWVPTRAGYPSQTGRTPTFLMNPQHAGLGVHTPPPPGSDIHVPSPAALGRPALRPASCQLPARLGPLGLLVLAWLAGWLGPHPNPSPRLWQPDCGDGSFFDAL